MQLQADQLEHAGFHMKDKFEFHELPAFIKLYLAKTNAATISYLIFNFLLFTGFVIQVMLAVKDKGHGAEYTLAFFSGVLLLVVLIPVHELIHAIAYKLCGAPKVSFTISLPKFMVLTVADRFVASRKEFITILLAPFIVISIVLISSYFFSGPYVQSSLVAAIFCHTLLCSGDFGLASYFLFHTTEELVTYDDSEEKASYFLSRKR